MSGTGTLEAWVGADAARYRAPNACKFVGGDDFLRLAMQAYLAAGRDLVPPMGTPWAEDGVTWSNAEDFYTRLLAHLGERLRRAAIQRGDLAEVPWSPQAEAAMFDRLAGAGRSPALKGHGCPASAAGASAPAVAVGPAAKIAQASDITIHGNQLFCGPERQGLPDDLPCPDTQPATEETP